MKKFISSLALLFISIAVFAQDEEEHSAEYQWGERNAVPVIIGVIVVIILVIWLVRRNRKPKV
ncbi:MAG: hypothetical protein JJE22_18535 [Bacteroidia bacterium]|nr:hypothetical protein [Bacteroidia bacterium]